MGCAMTITQYLNNLIRDKAERQLSKMSHEGILEILKKTDKSVWNSMEDLFGNLFTNLQSIQLHLDNNQMDEKHIDGLNKEIARSIGQVLTIKEYFTEAKQKS